MALVGSLPFTEIPPWPPPPLLSPRSSLLPLLLPAAPGGGVGADAGAWLPALLRPFFKVVGLSRVTARFVASVRTISSFGSWWRWCAALPASPFKAPAQEQVAMAPNVRATHKVIVDTCELKLAARGRWSMLGCAIHHWSQLTASSFPSTCSPPVVVFLFVLLLWIRINIVLRIADRESWYPATVIAI